VAGPWPGLNWLQTKYPQNNSFARKMRNFKTRCYGQEFGGGNFMGEFFVIRGQITREHVGIRKL
jgi:hypothetical protein